MDLKANHVVLSGCEMGLGQLSSGDELVGLTRAFIYAGTPSVVASLWKVDDHSTAQLMSGFYKNLKTMTKVEALRQAQLNMIRGLGKVTCLRAGASAASPSSARRQAPCALRPARYLSLPRTLTFGRHLSWWGMGNEQGTVDFMWQAVSDIVGLPICQNVKRIGESLW